MLLIYDQVGLTSSKKSVVAFIREVSESVMYRCYVQASIQLGPEDMSLLERCPYFRGCYVQASVELGAALRGALSMECTDL